MRLVIVSNRAPVSIIKKDGEYIYEESSGGLASGLRAYVERMKKKSPETEIIWIGWPGTTVEDEERVRKEVYALYKTICVFLTEDLMERFYEGFCNKTIWPLFHYFPGYTSYETDYWEQYKIVNKIFCDVIIDNIRPDDILWVHDYHLMLLPSLLRNKLPDASIGFFLHIPFPTYEIYRLLPRSWRQQLLEGLLGADLIGFHTFDYSVYFLRSVLRILGIADHMGEIIYKSRTVKVDIFAMGIDYVKYNRASKSKAVAIEILRLKSGTHNLPLILSIDRQDYSKGILNRLTGFRHFLENNPKWQQKITMVMIVIPSRIGLDSYQSIKSNIDEQVGNINGRFGTVDWMPIIYRYTSVPYNELIALYAASYIALVTPLRDGMNLIAKEFIACKNDNGVLILSEMAGAADELNEAIIINPNNPEEISNAINAALEMEPAEQKERLHVMQNRLANYTTFHWAESFLNTLYGIKEKQQRLSAKNINESLLKKIKEEFISADRRIIFLDYDGTIVPFTNSPEKAAPGENILQLLYRISNYKNTELIIISGRDRNTLEKWFGSLPVSIVAEHGLFIKKPGSNWAMLKPIRNSWKKKILPILKQYTARLSGSFIEEKEYSLVFHYRRSDPSIASGRTKELMHHLLNFTSNLDLQVMKGNKVVEVHNAGVDKGLAAMRWLNPDFTGKQFIMAAGDDHTDENLFRAMPQKAWTIKVGTAPSYAVLNVNHSSEMVKLLSALVGRIPEKELHKKNNFNS
jgi:trehalose 6-phosphate synthase/phosphatase